MALGKPCVTSTYLTLHFFYYFILYYINYLQWLYIIIIIIIIQGLLDVLFYNTTVLLFELLIINAIKSLMNKKHTGVNTVL